MTQKINIVFMGQFTYPHGMAGTRRVQHVINALKQYPGITVRVVLQRQSSRDNALTGEFDGTPYETVMGDLFRAKMFALLPMLYWKTIAALKRAFRPGQANIIYVYGPIFLDSILPLSYARKLGYKIVFDVIEDFGLVKEVSYSFYLNLRTAFLEKISARIKDLAAGIIVISSCLEKQCRTFAQGGIPVHYMPISVNMDHFPEKPGKLISSLSLFYAGSFGKKDGLPVLLDAFDNLAQKYAAIRLVLTGRGDQRAMKAFFDRVKLSPHKDRIAYKGYLDDAAYQEVLNEADIPCMTRADLSFANAGFPFKLGEFLATGKPVVASRVSDVDRFLTDKHNAMLVKPGAHEELCKAVAFLIDYPETAAAIGARGREVAQSFFDYRQQGAALYSFLDRL